MVGTNNADGIGGRFALLHTDPEPNQVWDSNPKSSKRRRRKSAKGILESEASSDGDTTVFLTGSSGSSTFLAKPPLRSISEAAVLRSNSAEPVSSTDALSSEASPLARQERQSAEDALQHTARRPHLSLSFQECRPVAEGKN